MVSIGDRSDRMSRTANHWPTGNEMPGDGIESGESDRGTHLALTLDARLAARQVSANRSAAIAKPLARLLTMPNRRRIVNEMGHLVASWAWCRSDGCADTRASRNTSHLDIWSHCHAKHTSSIPPSRPARSPRTNARKPRKGCGRHRAPCGDLGRQHSCPEPRSRHDPSRSVSSVCSRSGSRDDTERFRRETHARHASLRHASCALG